MCMSFSNARVTDLLDNVSSLSEALVTKEAELDAVQGDLRFIRAASIDLRVEVYIFLVLFFLALVSPILTHHTKEAEL